MSAPPPDDEPAAEAEAPDLDGVDSRFLPEAHELGRGMLGVEVADRAAEEATHLLPPGRDEPARARSRFDGRVTLVEGTADALPFGDDSFDHLTFTYLLRYVDEPGATMRELARVVRPGGTIAMLEFGLPSGLWRRPWNLWVDVGLPLAGRLLSPGWHDVGRFLGDSIREFHANHPPSAGL